MCVYSYKSPIRDAKVKTMTSQSPKHLTFPIWRILMAAVKIRTLSSYNCVRNWDIALKFYEKTYLYVFYTVMEKIRKWKFRHSTTLRSSVQNIYGKWKRRQALKDFILFQRFFRLQLEIQNDDMNYVYPSFPFSSFPSLSPFPSSSYPLLPFPSSYYSFLIPFS